ncbi:MAG: hypothetical protein IT563_00740 [Alphaproteobacteria bacterium]|nr:hypothetical protein [Alphaproteobacteria bacterium]
MQVRVDRDLRVVLDDPGDFGRFRLAVDADPGAFDQVRQALREIAELEGPEIAWVSEAWLRNHAPASRPDLWNEGFAKMLAYASKHGWTRGNPVMVRAHVVWLGQKE